MGDDYEPAAITDETSRRIVAFHEPDHVCGYLHFQLPFKDVHIRADGGGRLQAGCYVATTSVHVILWLCGPAAESILSGRPLLELCDGPCNGDCRRARDAWHRDDTCGLSLTALADQATELVRARWGAVATLAEALMAREQLDYHEVLQVLGTRA